MNEQNKFAEVPNRHLKEQLRLIAGRLGLKADSYRRKCNTQHLAQMFDDYVATIEEAIKRIGP